MKVSRFLVLGVFLVAGVGSSCTKAEKIILGSVSIQPELQKSLSSTASLYIIARSAGQDGGAPVAVKRFTQPLLFPLEFHLSPQDTMIPDTPFEGKFTITARIAQSGSATPASKGDIEGVATPNPVPVGEKNLKIVLDHVR